MRWLCVLALVASCGKSKATCKAEVADLMTLFRTMDRSPPALKIPDDVHLVSRPELPVFDGEEAPVLYVRTTGLELRGKTYDELGITAMLAEIANKTQSDIDSGKVPKRFVWDHRIYVVIDSDAPWRTVVSTARIAALAGYTKWIAVFSKPSPVAAPPRSAVSDQLDKIIADEDGGNKATDFANLFSKIIKSCPPVGKVFGAVGNSEGGDKAREMIDGMELALVECNCDLDMASLRSAFFAIAGNLHPLTMLVLQLDEKAKPLRLPATMPWHDAAKQLTTAAAWIELPN
jgi:hypothetical protein